MQFKKFLLLSCASLLVIAVLVLFLTPWLVAGGLRFWIAHAAQREGLQIEFEKIETPLLHPVVVHKLRIDTRTDAPYCMMVDASRVELALNFAAIFTKSRGRFLRFLTVDAVRVDIRRNPQPPATPQGFTWRILEDFLADNFKLSGIELHLEDSDTVVDLHDGTLSGTQFEAGVFSAGNITIASPWLRKDFSQLRGVTSWQESRLTVGALTLTRGLDLDAISIDLSHVSESRLGLEMALDAFGGKLRARFSSEDRAEHRTWDAAGTASEISLAQMSDALDLTDRASGSLHACKFTFRGEATNLREATASLWAEVTGLTWRDRTADTIMIGASLYNHQVQVEQLFVKQRNNQFNLNGESALPQKWSDWLNPDFHGDISASIKDLGDFARLFGARASDFAGQINISGKVNARERKLGGQLSASGNSLVLFRVPVESLSVELSLKESLLEIANCELHRKNDSFRGQGSLNLASDHNYSFTVSSSIAEIKDYAALIPGTLQGFPFGGSLNVDWTGTGTEAAHSGTFHVLGQRLHPLESSVIPFDAEFEGGYSPDNIFFRQFNLSNQHAAFGTLLTVAKDYLELQALHLDLNSKPRLQGNIRLPLSLSRWSAQSSWLGALSDDTNFDLNVTLDPIDLAELARAVTTQPKMSGQASGNLEIHGAPASLEGKSIIRLRDFVFGSQPGILADWETRASLGTLTAKGSVIPRGSDPISLEGTIPYKFEKQAVGYTFESAGPLSATLSFPAIFLSKLPLYLSRRIFVDGVLSGRLTLSGTPAHPRVLGNAQLIQARLLGGPSLSTGVTFEGQTAAIDFARVAPMNVRNAHASAGIGFTARGEIDFRDLTDVRMKVLPNEPMMPLTLLEPDDCVSGIRFSFNGATGLRGERIGELYFRGGLFAPDWTISLGETRAGDSLATLLRGDSSRTFPICHGTERSGTTLTLGLSRPTFP